MPGTVKVKVLSARNLPIMDRGTYLTDAFVELRLGAECFKTDVCRRTLNPVWNTDWYKFEMDDQSLQEQALQIRVLDHDTYSSHDAIGRVYFDLNPLLAKESQCRSINAWFPIYDTMHGIRGEINLIIRVEIFSDASRFRQSSVGVRFFYSTCIPYGYRVTCIRGLVSHLCVNDDPEHQWIERLRSSRTSNEARQSLFSQLSGEIQRKMGVKVLEADCNSVIGYQLYFDLEGETGIVARGIGTAVHLEKIGSGSPPLSPKLSFRTKGSVAVDSDPEEATCDETRKVKDTLKGTQILRPLLSYDVTSPLGLLEANEYPFLTISQLPRQFVKHYGSLVSAKSVKLVEKNVSATETRESWWRELRKEIRSHMRALECTCILAYREECSIYDDIVLLSAYGTAVTFSLQFEHQPSVEMDTFNLLTSEYLAENNEDKDNSNSVSLNQTDKIVLNDSSLSGSTPPVSNGEALIFVNSTSPQCNTDMMFNTNALKSFERMTSSEEVLCEALHVTYHDVSIANASNIRLYPCRVCQRAYVPDAIFSATELPNELVSLVAGKPALVQVRVTRWKQLTKGEACARELSEMLPFIEFELHRRLLQAMRVKMMNSLFGIRVRISIGRNIVVALATATALYLKALMPSAHPKVSAATEGLAGENLAHWQDQLMRHVRWNKTTYNLDEVETDLFSGKENTEDAVIKVKAPPAASSNKTSAASNRTPIASSGALVDQHSDTDNTFLVPREELDVTDALRILKEDIIVPKDMSIVSLQCLPLSIVLPSINFHSQSNSVSNVDNNVSAIIQSTKKNFTPKPSKVYPSECLHNITRLLRLGVEGVAEEAHSSVTSSPIHSQSRINMMLGGPSQGSLGNVKGIGNVAAPGSKWYNTEILARFAREGRQRPSVGGIVLPNTNGTSSAVAPSSSMLELTLLPTTGGLAMSLDLALQQLLTLDLRSLLYSCRGSRPCAVLGLDCKLTINEDDQLQVLFTCLCVSIPSSSPLSEKPHLRKVNRESGKRASTSCVKSQLSLHSEILVGTKETEKVGPQPVFRTISEIAPPKVKEIAMTSELIGSSDFLSSLYPQVSQNESARPRPDPEKPFIISPLSYAPYHTVEGYFGNLDFFFVRETTTVRDFSGVSGFVQACLSEVKAVVRAHALSLGANALLNFHISEAQVLNSTSRNQAQCLLNVCADMAFVVPYASRSTSRITSIIPHFTSLPSQDLNLSRSRITLKQV